MTAQETRKLKTGDWVYCTVYAVAGWYRVTDIRPRDGYIKIDAYKTWNPPHNFKLTDDHGRSAAEVWM